MIRKIVYYFFSFFLVVFLFITFSEIFLQILPFIYKKISFPTDKTYIYVLGESSAFGHPYMGKINFSKIVAKTTDWNIDDKKIEIINFAEPGSKPLYQYQKYSFYRYTHPFQKGMVFVYMLGTNGNIFDNDYANNKYKQYNEIIINSVLFLWTHPYFCKTFNLEYYYNALSKLMNKFGDEVYISTVVGNYSGIMPNNVESLIKDKDLREKIGLIDELILNNKYDEALQKISDIIDKYEDKSQILYRVGKIYEKQNKIKEANEVYRNMIGDDDARPTIKENEMIRTLAKQYKFELIDVEEELISRNEIIGFNYFMDLVHPTIDLNILIAKKFTDKLKQKHLINDNDYDIKEDILHEFSDKDWFIIYRDALGEIFFYSCRKYIFDNSGALWTSSIKFTKNN